MEKEKGRDREKYNHEKKQLTSKEAKKAWPENLLGIYVDSDGSLEKMENLDNTYL